MAQIIPICAALISLLTCAAQAESRGIYPHKLHISQEMPRQINFGFNHDTTRYKRLITEYPTAATLSPKDSLREEHYIYEAEKVIDMEKRDKSGDLNISFKIKNKMDWHYRWLHNKEANTKGAYIVKQQHTTRLDSKPTLGVDYISLQPQDNPFGVFPFITHYRAIDTDSLFAYTRPPLNGGYTSEWNTYYIYGDEVEQITTKTKGHFTVALGVYGFRVDSPESWYEHIYNLSTDWYDSNRSNRSFRITTIDRVIIDKQTFDKIRDKHKLALDKLMSRREYLIQRDKSFFTDVYERLDNAISPEKIDTTTLSGQRIFILPRAFTTHINIRYRDGSHRDLVLISRWEHSVP